MTDYDIYRVHKKTLVKEMCDVLKPLKCYHLALALIKTQKCHFSYGSKRWQFSVLINTRANGNIFRVKTSHISLTSVFWVAPCRYHNQSCDHGEIKGVWSASNLVRELKLGAPYCKSKSCWFSRFWRRLNALGVKPKHVLCKEC